MEPTNCSTKVLNGDVAGGQDQVDAVLVIDLERCEPNRIVDDLLDGEAGELGTLGVAVIDVLAGDDDGARDVGARLVRVEGDGAPPVGDGGGGSGTVVGRDGKEEVLDEELL